MNDRPLTPREAYESMMNGGDVKTGNPVNAAFARHLLRSQAGKLAVESCAEHISFTPDGTNPWVASVTFSGGELSENGQTLLAAMRSNAHRTEMVVDGSTVQIMFYVYTFEED